MIGLCIVFGLSCADAERPPPLPSAPVAAPAVRTLTITPPRARKLAVTVPVPWPETCPVSPPDSFRPHLVAAARKYPGGATACELGKLSFCESRFDVRARSPAGAGGPFQFVPATADELGIDRFDIREAAFGAARYQLWLHEGWSPPPFAGRTRRDIVGLRNGSWNWGRAAMYRDQKTNGWQVLDEAVPHLPHETQQFVSCNEHGHRGRAPRR